jgi:hypothetical protein
MPKNDHWLSQTDFDRFVMLQNTAFAQGFRLWRNGRNETPFRITRGSLDMCDCSSLDAVADWLADA